MVQQGGGFRTLEAEFFDYARAAYPPGGVADLPRFQVVEIERAFVAGVAFGLRLAREGVADLTLEELERFRQAVVDGRR